ncbi:MAG TPA: hypothetical protein VGR60_00600 [Gemmatimonadales bacterium]|nr:hypothetical protein [Gemmatimonadales bacterium]
MRWAIVPALLSLAGAPCAAQLPTVEASVLEALGHYREQGPTLDFSGSGPAGRLDLSWRRWGLTVRGSRVDYAPTDPTLGTEAFKATETEVSLRFQPLPSIPVSAEGGVVRRTTDPGDAAQDVRAFRLGVTSRFVIGRGAAIRARAAWLLGARFSGGGSAGTALSLGLAADYRPVARLPWAWAVVDYDFERIDRATAVPVPIERSIVRLGLEARFIP